jgi:hypothetical protein
MAAGALNAVPEKAYGIPLGQIIKDLASRIKQMRLTQFFKEHPEVAATIALVGAEVAVSLWQPSEPCQAELKMRIQDALQAVGMGAAASTAAEGLMALGLAIAAGSGGGIAAAALALIPVIAPAAYAAATGHQPSPYVKTAKASVGGAELASALIEPPEPWLPRKLAVPLGGKPLPAAEAQRALEKTFGKPLHKPRPASSLTPRFPKKSRREETFEGSSTCLRTRKGATRSLGSPSTVMTRNRRSALEEHEENRDRNIRGAASPINVEQVLSQNDSFRYGSLPESPFTVL